MEEEAWFPTFLTTHIVWLLIIATRHVMVPRIMDFAIIEVMLQRRLA